MKLKCNLAIQQVTDFWAAVPVGKDAKNYRCVISLNETAKDIVELLRDDITLEALVERMLALYDVPADDLRRDIDGVLDQLRTENLLAE